MAVKNAVARAAAVALLTTGALRAGIGAASADEGTGAPGGTGVALTEDGDGFMDPVSPLADDMTEKL